VLGGIGNIKGALLGGLLLGLIENWGASLFGSNQNMGTVTAFVVLVLVLMIRPNGLLGESMGRSRA
jgi:branched-chain amino acid transport system permease protein